MKKYTREDRNKPGTPGWFPRDSKDWPNCGSGQRRADVVLAEIEDPHIRKRALEICHWPDRQVTSIPHALLTACKLWCHTDEGELYWRKIYNSYAKHPSGMIHGIYESDPIRWSHLDLSQTETYKMPRR